MEKFGENNLAPGKSVRKQLVN